MGLLNNLIHVIVFYKAYYIIWLQKSVYCIKCKAFIPRKPAADRFRYSLVIVDTKKPNSIGMHAHLIIELNEIFKSLEQTISHGFMCERNCVFETSKKLLIHI